MGDPEGWPQPSGLLPEGSSSLFPSLDDERWLRAEDRTLELITRIQPTKSSEERRRAVSDYVQRLIRKCIDCQVFTFGSVPLKTYLPDGDIDLTAFSRNLLWKETWANEVRNALEAEEHSQEAEFRVKEVQYIQAEVKIIKCLVENIVVDISFNQLGGLCTLCFLEEVDRLIGQDHLFKRSIILVKAWCYYESRILGAHHGLISTYALETLVLYIFHVFHASLRGPLAVLFRFLEFFSKFDWDKYSVSLWGPVPVSGLPDIPESPRKDGGKLLLSKEFLETCGREYAVYPNVSDRTFTWKYLNVIDPLKTTNNLGRSVSKGNFFRIRSAFTYGARKLARILECPMGDVVDELDKFFLNTWDRHGSGKRPDAPEHIERLSPPTYEAFGNDSDERESQRKEKMPVSQKKKERPLGDTPIDLTAEDTRSTQRSSPSTNKEVHSANAEPVAVTDWIMPRNLRNNAAAPGGEEIHSPTGLSGPRESFQKLAISPGGKLPPPSLWGNTSLSDVPSFYPRAPLMPMNHMEDVGADGVNEEMPPPRPAARDSVSRGSNSHLEHAHQLPVLTGPPPPPPANLDPAGPHPRKGRPVENQSGPYYYAATGIPLSYVPLYGSYYVLPPEAAGADFNAEFPPLPTLEDGAQPMCGVGDRLSAAGIPISAGLREGTSGQDTRFEHLSSDFASHLRNLDYGRACQQTPFFIQQPMPPPVAKEHHMWEGPGRPNMKQVGHGRGRGYHRAFVGPPGFGGDEPSKGRAGTGTYLPARHRDRQFRGHYEGYQERSDYDAPPRYRYGRGQTNRMTQSSGKGDKGGWHDGSYNIRNAIPLSPAQVQGMMDVYPHMNGNGNAAPLLLLYPYGNPNEQLEFGTLGPLQAELCRGGSSSSSSVRMGSDRQQHQHQQHQQQPQQHHPSSPGDQQRSPELTYQMKEEDFPPLFRGQVGGSAGASGSSSPGSSSTRSSSYQTYVASPS